MLCSCQPTSGIYQKIEGKAQGTTYAITFTGGESSDLKPSIDSIFRIIDKSMSLWDSSSLICRFNKSSAEQTVDRHFQTVLEKSFRMYDQSEGAFDPTIGPFVQLWKRVFKQEIPAPDSAGIDSMHQFVGLKKVRLSGNTVVKDHPSIQLDFNAIAQGYTVDVLADFLEQQGIKNCLIELGGEVRAKGRNSENEPWKVGIETPQFNETETLNAVQTVVGLHDKSLATSGSYRNFVQENGSAKSHILNPATGRSVGNEVIAVSVLAPTCAEADAWATAFMVMGKEKSLETARKYGLEIRIVSFKNKQFEFAQTAGFNDITDSL